MFLCYAYAANNIIKNCIYLSAYPICLFKFTVPSYDLFISSIIQNNRKVLLRHGKTALPIVLLCWNYVYVSHKITITNYVLRKNVDFV